MIFTPPLSDNLNSSPNNSAGNLNADCLGIVLAGGLSSRMGKNKAQLSRNDTSMVDYSKKLLADIGIKNMVISGAFDAQPSNELTRDILVPDIIKKGGPVAGLYSVLQRYQPKAVFIMPVDLPLMTSHVLQQLKTTGELTNKACFFQTRDGDHNIPLYLPNNAYLELFLAAAFKKTESFNPKGPSMKSLLKQVPHHTVVTPNTQIFNDALFNTNTPEQWQLASKKFS